jgi:hypothetical protein
MNKIDQIRKIARKIESARKEFKHLDIGLDMSDDYFVNVEENGLEVQLPLSLATPAPKFRAPVLQKLFKMNRKVELDKIEKTVARNILRAAIPVLQEADNKIRDIIFDALADANSYAQDNLI